MLQPPLSTNLKGPEIFSTTMTHVCSDPFLLHISLKYLFAFIRLNFELIQKKDKGCSFYTFYLFYEPLLTLAKKNCNCDCSLMVLFWLPKAGRWGVMTYWDDLGFQNTVLKWFLINFFSSFFFFTSAGQILQKDQEIKDLKQKIAEVMAVMPSIAYTAGTSTLSPVSPHYSSKFVETSSSGLDPNASVYQPLKKWMPAAISPSNSPPPPPPNPTNFVWLESTCKSICCN